MSIVTNRLAVKMDYDALFADFDIFCIQPDPDRLPEKHAKKVFYGRSIVDASLHDLKALSSAFNNHAEAFLLFPKSDHLTENAFADRVEAAFDGFTGRRLQKHFLLENSPAHDKRFYFGNRVIAQLLINALANYTDEGRFHNLSATLLHLAEPEKKFTLKSGKLCRQRVYLEYRITAGMYLKVSVRTFQHIDGSDMHDAPYVFDPDICDLRRALPTDDERLARFEERTLKGRRNNVDFLDFSSLAKFRNSRAGVMLEFVEAINQRLGKYIHVSFLPFENNTSVVKSSYTKADKMLAIIREHFQSRTIYIQNRIGADGENLLALLLSALEKHHVRYRSITTAQTIPAHQLALVILHPREWYDMNGQDDPYPALHEKQALLQVVTENVLMKEDGSTAPKLCDAVLQTILKELWIKDDLLQGTFTMPIHTFALSSPWYFVSAVKHPKSRRDDPDEYTFYRVKLTPNGNMTFDSFTDRQSAFFSVEGKIQDLFHTKAGNDFLAQDEKLEGIMYCDENNLHKIVRTNWWALPNLHDIRDTLVLSDGGRTLAKEKLQTLLDMFVQLYPQYKEAVSKAKECSQSLGKTFSIKMLKNLSSQNPLSGKNDKVFSGKHTWVKEFSDFWFRTERTNGETEPILLVPRFKANPDKTYQPFTYGLADITNIQTFVHTIPLLSNHMAVGKRTLYARGYFSGIRMSGLQTKLARGSVLRNIIPEEGMPDQSSEILPLLDVDFVMSNYMFSVLPFPFKYLREYAKSCEAHDSLLSEV